MTTRFEHRGIELIQSDLDWHYSIRDIKSGNIIQRGLYIHGLTQDKAEEVIDQILKFIL